MNNPERRTAPYPSRVPDSIERWSPARFHATVLFGALLVSAAAWFFSPWWALLAVPVATFAWMGWVDLLQTRQAIRKNFPVLGRMRYVLEGVRPEIRQYFVEDDDDPNPVSRESRSIVYSRAKGQLETLPFGTRHDVYAEGYEWMHHSMSAVHHEGKERKIRIGEASGIAQPYDASVINISAMSYGSLSENAVLALNEGAKLGGFAHNTGEGGISPFHLKPGGDLIWQIGTGYFGCRTPSGSFSPEAFAKNAKRPSVKMIEIKISQGAKPGHGGILPAEKVTPEIAEIRGVAVGQAVNSPPAHSVFTNPIELLHFVQRLRDLSGGKPVGFKFCVGSRQEFLGIVKAMRETEIVPDFIAIDGAEGGTGAAPLEFSNSVGTPLVDGLLFVHHSLIAAGLRDKTKLIASGRITTSFHVLRLLALGADLTQSARAMMFALGCIQALKCNTNHCPVGVATQDPKLMKGLHPGNKAQRVFSFHRRTIEAMYELLGAAGLQGPQELTPRHIRRRAEGGGVMTYAEIFPDADDGFAATRRSAGGDAASLGSRPGGFFPRRADGRSVGISTGERKLARRIVRGRGVRARVHHGSSLWASQNRSTHAAEKGASSPLDAGRTRSAAELPTCARFLAWAEIVGSGVKREISPGLFLER